MAARDAAYRLSRPEHEGAVQKAPDLAARSVCATRPGAGVTSSGGSQAGMIKAIFKPILAPGAAGVSAGTRRECP
jgi:hypothetical protein